MIHFKGLLGIKKPIGKGAGRLKARRKVGPRGNVCVYVGDFSLFSVVLFRSLLRDKHKHCGVCGRDDISGYYRRGFGEGFCVCVCAKGRV